MCPQSAQHDPPTTPSWRVPLRATSAEATPPEAGAPPARCVGPHPFVILAALESSIESENNRLSNTTPSSYETTNCDNDQCTTFASSECNAITPVVLVHTTAMKRYSSKNLYSDSPVVSVFGSGAQLARAVSVLRSSTSAGSKPAPCHWRRKTCRTPCQWQTTHGYPRRWELLLSCSRCAEGLVSAT